MVMFPDEVGCDTEEPRASIRPLRIELVASLKRDQEGIGQHVIRSTFTDAANDVTVKHRRVSNE